MALSREADEFRLDAKIANIDKERDKLRELLVDAEHDITHLEKKLKWCGLGAFRRWRVNKKLHRAEKTYQEYYDQYKKADEHYHSLDARWRERHRGKKSK
jgi:hypothetical protein